MNAKIWCFELIAVAILMNNTPIAGVSSIVQHSCTEQYMARSGQDKLLDLGLFGGKQGGFFVEIGTAGLGGNTRFLEEKRQWRGVRINSFYSESVAHVIYKQAHAQGRSIIDYCCLLSETDAMHFFNNFDFEQLPVGVLSVRVSTSEQRPFIRMLCKEKGFVFFNRIVLNHDKPEAESDEVYVHYSLKKNERTGCSQDEKFILLTTMFAEKDPERIQEYARCFAQNCANDLIEKICVFCESIDPSTFGFLKHPKIVIVGSRSRPSFADLVHCANTLFSNRTVIISNTDIYFDDTLALVHSLNLSEMALVLTRYNVPEYTGNWYRHALSYDSYIFKTPTRPLEDLDFCLGHVGCDLCFADRFVRAGYNIVNPSLSIKTWHVHNNDYREYKNTGEGAPGWRLIRRIFIGFSSVEDFKQAA